MNRRDVIFCSDGGVWTSREITQETLHTFVTIYTFPYTTCHYKLKSVAFTMCVGRVIYELGLKDLSSFTKDNRIFRAAGMNI